MKSQIISIGDELLSGDTINTNAGWLGNMLAECGVEVERVHTIGDNAALIQQALRLCMQQADLVITTGGLGPTHDDITKKAVADIFNAEMILHQPTLSFIKDIFEKRNIPFSKSNYYQAEVPANCEVLFNKQGTAPGLWFEENGSRLAVLPGIPYEMKALMKNEVLPKIKPLTSGLSKTFVRHIKIAGVGESTISDDLIGPLDDYLIDDISVAYLPSPQANTVRINTRAENEEEANAKSQKIRDYIYQKAGKFIIGEGKYLTPAEAVGNILNKNELTLSVAESCTGGFVANSITDIPGSSDYMMGGIIAYANHIKTEFLEVDEDTLSAHGAVSKPLALQMAKGVAQLMGTDIGISTTGIAGPGGGTKEKPVGTVWIGFWSNNQHFALQTQLTKNRLINKERTAAIALETVRRSILKIETMPYGLKPHHA